MKGLLAASLSITALAMAVVIRRAGVVRIETGR
jgi:hypothetical protein